MKLAMLSSNESVFDLCEDLRTSLEGKIADLQTEIFTVQKHIDLPKKLKSLEGFDVAAVFIHYSKENASLKVAIEKISEVDIDGTYIMALIEEVQVPEDASGEEVNELKMQFLSKAENELMSAIIK